MRATTPRRASPATICRSFIMYDLIVGGDSPSRAPDVPALADDNDAAPSIRALMVPPQDRQTQTLMRLKSGRLSRQRSKVLLDDTKMYIVASKDRLAQVNATLERLRPTPGSTPPRDGAARQCRRVGRGALGSGPSAQLGDPVD
jgi:hypothetical protein